MNNINCKKISGLLTIIITLIITGCVPPGTIRYNKFSNLGNSRKNIIKTAERYIGVQYKNGGTSPSGFDCSGYVQYVYYKSGYELPRSSINQFRRGREIPLRYAKPGDLVFFNTSGKNISHVAIYMGGNRFIHAPSSGKRVSYASINNSYWKERFVSAVTYFKKKSAYRSTHDRRSSIPVRYQ